MWSPFGRTSWHERPVRKEVCVRLLYTSSFVFGWDVHLVLCECCWNNVLTKRGWALWEKVTGRNQKPEEKLAITFSSVLSKRLRIIGGIVAGFNTGGKNGFARVQPRVYIRVFSIVKNVEIVRDERKQGNSKVSRTNTSREKGKLFSFWFLSLEISSYRFFNFLFFFFHNGNNIANFSQPILQRCIILH